jgi:hypothetical protein
MLARHLHRRGWRSSIRGSLMRPITLSLVVFTLIASLVQSQEQGAEGKKKAELRERRCAFLGHWGSFHLIGSNGSAAYTLGINKYIADLRSNGEDANYWYYAPLLC